MAKLTTLLSATLIALVALLNLLRVFKPILIEINHYPIPLWTSALVFIGCGALSAYLFQAARHVKNSDR